MMICFFIGFIAHSAIIKSVIENVHLNVKGKRFSFLQLFLPLSLVVGYFVLFSFGPWQTFLLLAFSIIYGIISLDLKKNKAFDVDR